MISKDASSANLDILVTGAASMSEAKTRNIIGASILFV